MPLLPVPTKQKEMQRPARRESGEGREWEAKKKVLKMSEIICVSAWSCPGRKGPRERVDASQSRGWNRPEDVRGTSKDRRLEKKVKIDSLSLFVSRLSAGKPQPVVHRETHACARTEAYLWLWLFYDLSDTYSVLKREWKALKRGFSSFYLPLKRKNRDITLKGGSIHDCTYLY